MYLLDTDVVIWHLRRRGDIARIVERLSKERLGISVLTQVEVRIGTRDNEQSFTDYFMKSLVSHSVTPDIAEKAAEFIRRYRREGISLQLPDAVIAATAAVNDLILVTLNPKHYPMPEIRKY